MTALCDSALAKVIAILGVSTVIGIGKFAEYWIRETVKAAGYTHIHVRM